MNKKLLILGAGFGLYGYLPAALENGFDVFTLNRYKNFLLSRKDLSCFLSKVVFVEEASIEFSQFDGIVIARTPEQQSKLVSINLDFRGHLFLEKPLGVNAETHESLINMLAANRLEFTVAYLFRYLEWYEAVLDAGKKESTIYVDWNIPIHAEHSWKSVSASGGGLVSYYGTHLLSMLVDLGVLPESLQISNSPGSLVLSGSAGPARFELNLSYSQNPEFNVLIRDNSDLRTWKLSSPFGAQPVAGVMDPRVGVLSKYFENLIFADSFEARILHERKVVNLRKLTEGLM